MMVDLAFKTMNVTGSSWLCIVNSRCLLLRRFGTGLKGLFEMKAHALHSLSLGRWNLSNHFHFTVAAYLDHLLAQDG